MGTLFAWASRLLLIAPALVPAVAVGAVPLPPLSYAFKTVGDDPVVYRLTEVVADQGRSTTTIVYFCCGVKPVPAVGGMENLDLLSRDQQMALGGEGGDFTPQPQLFRPMERTGGVIMDRFGRLTPARQAGGGDRPLPGALGVAREMIVPELTPDGTATWQVSHPWTIYERTPFGLRFQPRQQAAGSLTINYTAGTAKEDTVPVTYKTDMSATSASFSEHLSGDGSFEFDTRRGLVRSLSARFTAEGNFNGTPYSTPISLDVTLLPPEEVARLKEAGRKMMADFEARRATEAASGSGATQSNPALTGQRHQDPTWADRIDLPAGTQRTAFVGHSTGGMPFVAAGDGKRMVIGFRLKLGDWGGQTMIGRIEPLYDAPEDLHPKGETVMLAKAGYAVGGLWLNGPDQADALRVIYMRRTASGALDPKDAYVGPWFGRLAGPGRLKAGGTGQPVVGVYGRQGMNTDALGVVLGAGDATVTNTADPTDDPNYQGTDVPVPAKRPAAK